MPVGLLYNITAMHPAALYFQVRVPFTNMLERIDSNLNVSACSFLFLPNHLLSASILLEDILPNINRQDLVGQVHKAAKTYNQLHPHRTIP